jgi:hypothetical protein
MHDRISLSSVDSSEQTLAIHHIRDDGLCTQTFQPAGFPRGAGDADYLIPRRFEGSHQWYPQSASSARNQYSHGFFPRSGVAFFY